jgi:hypothetical protein
MPPRRKPKKCSFHQELVLNRWVMRFFKGNQLAALKMRLGEASKWNAPHMVAISFDRHLFYPLAGCVKQIERIINRNTNEQV